MDWRYKVDIWIFWNKAVCLSVGASGFWAFVISGLLTYIFKIQPSSNNIYGIYLIWVVLSIALFPPSTRALYRLRVKQTHGEFYIKFLHQSKLK